MNGYMHGRKERIEAGLSYLAFDFPSLAQVLQSPFDREYKWQLSRIILLPVLFQQPAGMGQDGRHQALITRISLQIRQ